MAAARQVVQLPVPPIFEDGWVYSIVFARRDSGRIRVIDDAQVVGAKVMQRLIATAKVLAKYGALRDNTRNKPLRDDILEFKERSGGRLFYYLSHERNEIVLTSAYVKKKDKTDPEQIDRAVRIRSEYEAILKREADRRGRR